MAARGQVERTLIASRRHSSKRRRYVKAWVDVGSSSTLQQELREKPITALEPACHPSTATNAPDPRARRCNRRRLSPCPQELVASTREEFDGATSAEDCMQEGLRREEEIMVRSLCPTCRGRLCRCSSWLRAASRGFSSCRTLSSSPDSRRSISPRQGKLVVSRTPHCTRNQGESQRAAMSREVVVVLPRHHVSGTSVSLTSRSGGLRGSL